MAVEDLPAGFTTFTREQITTRWLRDYKLRNPSADVTSGQPVLDAAQIADALLPLYGNASRIADGINESASRGEQLDRVGARIGLPRGKATGASGYVEVDASVGGFTAFAGDELENPATRLRYQAAETKHVDDGDHVRIKAKSTGPSTDVPAGTVLRWTSPRPGSGQNVTVVEQSGGRGLSGGADVEGDERYLQRIEARKRNPPAGDNDAELVEAIQQTPDVPVEQVFTYPGYQGPGSTGYTFTVLTPRVGARRFPTTSQLQAAREWLKLQFPGDDSYFPLEPLPVDLFAAFVVEWAIGAWEDVAPWPERYVDDVEVVSATDALTFTLSGLGSPPLPGHTIGLWDDAKGKFRRKRISTVTEGMDGWEIVCTTENGASETSYTPIAGQHPSPWSDNLDAAALPVLQHLATLGPGEITDVPTLLAEGRRKCRHPRPPKQWPYLPTARLLAEVNAIAPVLTASRIETGVGDELDVGNPPNMLRLDDLAFFTRDT